MVIVPSEKFDTFPPIKATTTFDSKTDRVREFYQEVFSFLRKQVCTNLVRFFPSVLIPKSLNINIDCLLEGQYAHDFEIITIVTIKFLHA